MTRDRLAVIEVGSKGIRLLVAEQGDTPEAMQVLRSQGDLGFLGEGLEQNRGRMRRANIDRSLALVRKYLGMAQGYNPTQVVLVGTEVFRRAENVEEFRAGLPRPLELRVLRPEEEAVGSFLAVCWGFRQTVPEGGRVALIDLGGGSVEVVGGLQGSPARPTAGVSMPALGTLRLNEVWRNCSDPARCDGELIQHVEEEIERHGTAIARFQSPPKGEAEPLLVAGLGSTVTDSVWLLARGSGQKYSSERVHGLRAGVEELAGLRRQLLAALRGGAAGAEMLEDVGIRDPLGHQLGLAALVALLKRLNAPEITASGTGLRFGLAYALLHNGSLVLSRDQGKDGPTG